MTTAFEYSIIRLQEAVKERENSIKEYQSHRLFSQFDIDDNNSMIHEAEEEKREYENAIKILSKHSTKEQEVMLWVCQKGDGKSKQTHVAWTELERAWYEDKDYTTTPLIKKTV